MKRIYGVDSVFGNGQTFYDENGQMVGYSIDSVLGGGQNFYNADGQHVGYSIDSIFGNGQSLYSDTDGFAGYTIDSVIGGGHVFCKTEMQKNAERSCRLLQLQNVGSCRRSITDG